MKQKIHLKKKPVAISTFAVMFILLLVFAIVSILIITSSNSNNTHTLPAASINRATPDPDLIDLPAIRANANFTLHRTTTPPLITQRQAMQAVSDWGIPFALGGVYNGKTVIISATHGLATFGQAGDISSMHLGDGSHPTGVCAGWVGPCDYPIQSCVKGNCVPAGKIAGPLANRSMWMLDYSNVPTIGVSRDPNGSPLPVYTHTVYIVDEAAGSALMVWSY